MDSEYVTLRVGGDISREQLSELNDRLRDDLDWGDDVEMLFPSRSLLLIEAENVSGGRLNKAEKFMAENDIAFVRYSAGVYDVLPRYSIYLPDRHDSPVSRYTSDSGTLLDREETKQLIAEVAERIEDNLQLIQDEGGAAIESDIGISDILDQYFEPADQLPDATIDGEPASQAGI